MHNLVSKWCDSCLQTVSITKETVTSICKHYCIKSGRKFQNIVWRQLSIWHSVLKVVLFLELNNLSLPNNIHLLNTKSWENVSISHTIYARYYLDEFTTILAYSGWNVDNKQPPHTTLSERPIQLQNLLFLTMCTVEFVWLPSVGTLTSKWYA